MMSGFTSISLSLPLKPKGSSTLSKETFKSYVKANGAVGHLDAPHDEEAKGNNSHQINEENADSIVNFLSGEMLIKLVGSVTRAESYNDELSAVKGTLVVTNFRVSFIPDVQLAAESMARARNKLLGPYDFPLTRIVALNQVSKGKRKRLAPGQMLSTFVKRLEVCCRDFEIQVHCYRFKGDHESAKSIVNAIIHHAFPSRMDLLFAFSYQASEKPSPAYRTREFLTAEDWTIELNRLNVTDYRVTNCNEKYFLSKSVSENFIVPNSLLDSAIWKWNYFPVWSYSNQKGAALLRMSYASKEAEDVMLGHIKQSHPMQRKAEVVDLSDSTTCDLPSLSDLQTSFEKLLELCLPLTIKELQSSDSCWCSNLEATQWLTCVSGALKTAARVAQSITFTNRTVVIKERSGADMTPLVSSLAQLLMDPYSRSMRGLQELVEREWCALGHRMRDRCANVDTKDSEQSPVFCLFIDCVWQLTQQFPSSFGVSELFLSALFDSVSTGLFRQFVFNSVSERLQPELSRLPPSVWDWSLQFDPTYISRLANPLYTAAEMLRRFRASDVDLISEACVDLCQSRAAQSGSGSKSGSLSPKLTHDSRRLLRLQDAVLTPQSAVPCVRLWERCYLCAVTPRLRDEDSELHAQECVMREIVQLQESFVELSACDGAAAPCAAPRKTKLTQSRSMSFAPKPAPRPLKPQVSREEQTSEAGSVLLPLPSLCSMVSLPLVKASEAKEEAGSAIEVDVIDFGDSLRLDSEA